jgi:hypothetical protein
MALIPPDVGLRMRLQAESSLLQPLAPAHEIPSDLPELRPGQTFTARIQEALPDNTYQALVAGKQLTLQLPEGAKSGDLLELLVIDRSPKVVIARQVDAGIPPAAEETAPYPFAKFSPAARLIGQLLPAEGQAAPAVPLNRGQPLLPQAPQAQAAAAQLAPVLAKAVAQSGMFYEAHQAQWVAGRLPLEHLLQEPQGQRSNPALLEQAAAANAARPAAPAAQPAVNASSILQALAAGADKVGPAGTATAGAQPAPAMLAQQVPDDLRPLVQQQLEAGASQRMFWHGTVWPQQALDWAIECGSEREADGKEEQEATWRTALSLTTPRLGHIDASLQLSAGGVRITIAAAAAASADGLRAAAPQLAAALEAAGLSLHGFQVRHGAAQEGA